MLTHTPFSLRVSNSKLKLGKCLAKLCNSDTSKCCFAWRNKPDERVGNHRASLMQHRNKRRYPRTGSKQCDGP